MYLILRSLHFKVGSSIFVLKKPCPLALLACLTHTQNYRRPLKYRKHTKLREEANIEDVNYTPRNEQELDNLLERNFLLPISGHQVLVIQPFIKWGFLKKRNTTPELQLDESVTLIKTLREWTVVDQIIISLTSFNKWTLFGKGNLQMLKEKIKNDKKISAVFISINTLRLIQQKKLEEVFNVPVFDRYSVIMHIFKEHATSREAKLQIQLAQLPYLWGVLSGMNHWMGEKFGVNATDFGGEGPRLLSNRREVFKLREAKIKKEITELKEYRDIIREKRKKTDIPIVAVIGYTNAGKTSVVKALTGKKSLEPQDYLFATLDVTSHLGKLPSGLDAYFIDTLGFISDIPTYLIQSFQATLEDAKNADLIIHIRDISHPDTVAQNDNVLQILEDMKVPNETLKNMITVGNKIDLVNKKELEEYKDLILISSTKLIGIEILRQEIEKKILGLVDKNKLVIRVESGSEEYSWLQEWSTVVTETPDPKNNQYMLIETIISSSNLAKFKHYFIKNYKKT